MLLTERLVEGSDGRNRVNGAKFCATTKESRHLKVTKKWGQSTSKTIRRFSS